MKTTQAIRRVLLLLLLLGMPPERDVALAAGQINWLQGYVSAVGRGYARKSGNPMDADRAILAAKTVAQRELLESIKGVMVDNQTAVSDLMSEKAETSVRVQGVLHNALLVGEPQLKESGDSIVATVEMRVCLYPESSGCKSGLPLTSMLPKPQGPKSNRGKSCGLSPNVSATREILSKVTYDTNQPLTLFVVNLKGKPFNTDSKDFVIGFVAEDGQKCSIYGPDKVDPAVRRERGTAEIFLHASDAARKYAPNTVTITADTVENNNYIIVDRKDAYLMNLINEKEMNSLFKEAKIGVGAGD